ncbi:heat shock protein 30 [Thozetella sp. PMI_491]|nr:heat shock protein 30 [Thozetella sp. PMI_491]
MAFFCNPYASSANTSFTPLLRLLDDFDSYSRQAPAQRSHRTHVQSFTPKFDVREVDDAYELHGEFPGLNKDNVHIEFTDPQTLRIYGRVERSYTSSTPSEAQEPAAAVADTASETSEKRHSYQTTVEDDEEFENVESPNSSVSKTVPAESEAPKEDAPQPEAPKEAKTADKAKYWISERSIGQFSRTFSFPVYVQQEAVTANLNDGVLSVRVPKAPKDIGRRHIQLN